MRPDDAAERAKQRAAEQAAYEEELDAFIAAVRRKGGPELTRGEMHRFLFHERERAARKEAEEREAKVFSILADLPVLPERHEPAWLRWYEWSRDDFVRAVAWDQARGGQGGRRAVADRCGNTSASALYRRWQAIAPGEPWPSGNKGPREP